MGAAYVVQAGMDVNVGRVRAISLVGASEVVGSWRSAVGECGRAAGFGELALVLRRTRALRAAQHERSGRIAIWRCGSAPQLMVSSAQRVRRTMGDGGIAREAPEALADDGLWIGSPTRECDEAAVHVERRARAWAAIGGGWFDDDLRVVEKEGLVAEELGDALRDELIAEPFGLAEAFPAVAPVGIEAASAFEACDVVEDGCEPHDQCMDRPGP